MRIRLFGKDGECIEIGDIKTVSIENDHNVSIYIATEINGNVLGIAAGDKNFAEYAQHLNLRQAKVVELKAE